MQPPTQNCYIFIFLKKKNSRDGSSSGANTAFLKCNNVAIKLTDFLASRGLGDGRTNLGGGGPFFFKLGGIDVLVFAFFPG